MATPGESPAEAGNTPPHPPESSPPPLPSAKIASKAVENAASWIDDTLQQALIYQNTVTETVESTIQASRSRLSQIRETSSAHFNQTLDSLRDIASEYTVYEHMLFGKVKEGVNVAASYPLISGGVAFGVGIFSLKRTRRFLYYSTLRIFSSEEALLSQADLKVKELRQSIDRLKAESEKLERRTTVAEQELIRGRMKLRQAGKQIQGVIHSAYKTEKQAAGLKDLLKELPRREASRFRSQVSNLASEAKQERNALTKEVNKISNYGIPV
ncbi:PREDICTED: uncharacterized protein LOC104802474 [Tarenaya hassleriana]|uniref:uncharacterized protein LOC104802474 n=1 Tax=Tarenaya hassleriana TaxID=28532 RepID=UPI00053C97BD|nr:PREDICTED: uncharacterized protein LOC104802474 [Tarenaya hassleriana]